MNTSPPSSIQEHGLYVHWPFWAKVYAVTLGAPMVAVSLGLGFWLVLTQFDGLLRNKPLAPSLMLMLSSLVNFGFGAWLFYASVRRTIEREPEALTFAATGHLLIAVPALVFVIVSLFVNPERFINAIFYALRDWHLILELRLIVWVAINIYLALVLALADNSWQYFEVDTQPSTNNTPMS
jgi:hypothetical protein